MSTFPSQPSSNPTTPSSSTPYHINKKSIDNPHITNPDHAQSRSLEENPTTPHNPVNIPVRKSTRQVQPPTYLKDYHYNLLSNTIHNPNLTVSTSSLCVSTLFLLFSLMTLYLMHTNTSL